VRDPAADDWLCERPDGLRVAVKVTPRAARDLVTGVERDAAGRARLAVRLTAPPEGGRANAALLRLLARRWRLAARDLELAGGAAARQKLVRIAGVPAGLARHLRALEEGGAEGDGAARHG